MLYRLVHEPIGLNSCIPLQFPDYPAWLWLLFQRWQQLGQPFFFRLGQWTLLPCLGMCGGERKSYCISAGTAVLFGRIVGLWYMTNILPPQILIALYTQLLKNPPKRGLGEGKMSSVGVERILLVSWHAGTVGFWALKLTLFLGWPDSKH